MPALQYQSVLLEFWLLDSHSSLLIMHFLGGSRWWFKYMSPCLRCGWPRGCAWLLALGCASSSCGGYLEHEPKDRRFSLSPSFSLSPPISLLTFQISQNTKFKLPKKMTINCLAFGNRIQLICFVMWVCAHSAFFLGKWRRCWETTKNAFSLVYNMCVAVWESGVPMAKWSTFSH